MMEEERSAIFVKLNIVGSSSLNETKRIKLLTLGVGDVNDHAISSENVDLLHSLDLQNPNLCVIF